MNQSRERSGQININLNKGFCTAKLRKMSTMEKGRRDSKGFFKLNPTFAIEDLLAVFRLT